MGVAYATVVQSSQPDWLTAEFAAVLGSPVAGAEVTAAQRAGLEAAPYEQWENLLGDVVGGIVMSRDGVWSDWSETCKGTCGTPSYMVFRTASAARSNWLLRPTPQASATLSNWLSWPTPQARVTL